MTFTSDNLPAAEVIRSFGYWQQQALIRPLTITHHGRARVMLISIEEVERLRAAASDPPSEKPSDSSLQPVLDNMTEGFAAFDSDLTIVEVNRVAEAYFGITRSALLGHKMSGTIDDPSTPLVEQILRRVARTGEVSTFEASSKRHPYRRYSATAFPYGAGTALLFTNITEREILRVASDDWKALVAAMACMQTSSWFKLDGRGRVVDAGSGFETLTGFSVQQLSAFRMFDIVANADRRRLQSAFEDLMQAGNPAELNIRLMVKDGSERLMQVCMAPIARDFATLGAMAMISALPGEASVSAAA